ncbi:MAG: ribosome-associated translation inhibitor RaiA, partial [Burkholderiales bacterium]|nr:ribosome-associated translation inhibitor RaiA [Burkholderiales bacterium]
MNLSISAHHVNVTEAIELYLRNKMNRIARHFEHSIDINIILSVSKHEHKAEAKLHFYGRDLFCESVELNLYRAID